MTLCTSPRYTNGQLCGQKLKRYASLQSIRGQQVRQIYIPPMTLRGRYIVDGYIGIPRHRGQHYPCMYYLALHSGGACGLCQTLGTTLHPPRMKPVRRAVSIARPLSETKTWASFNARHAARAKSGKGARRQRQAVGQGALHELNFAGGAR